MSEHIRLGKVSGECPLERAGDLVVVHVEPGVHFAARGAGLFAGGLLAGRGDWCGAVNRPGLGGDLGYATSGVEAVSLLYWAS